MKQKQNNKTSKFASYFRVRWMLIIYDIILASGVTILFLRLPQSTMGWEYTMAHAGMAVGIIILLRFLWRVYHQIWRYGGVQSYIALMIADGCATFTYYTLQHFVFINAPELRLTFRQIACFIPVGTLLALALRMAYRFVYKRLNRNTKFGHHVVKLINFFGRSDWTIGEGDPVTKIKIAIVGAGGVGTGLAEELLNNPKSTYVPVIFVDNDKDKLGRAVFGKEVIFDDDRAPEILKEHGLEYADKVLYHEVNQGKGAALRTGFKEISGDVAIVQDADFEYDPMEIPSVVQPIFDGKADVVYGSRFAGGNAHRVLYFWHSLGNTFLTLLSNMCTDLNLTDMETCYKLFKREIIQSINIEEDRFGFEPEVTAKIAQLGCNIYEVGISYYGRTYAEGKKIGWKDGVRAIYVILKYALKHKKLAKRLQKL